jgi:hypothetical protein
MQKKTEPEWVCESTPVCCHETYMGFLRSLLAYLRDAEADEKQQREDFAKIEALATELKAELPKPHEREGIDIDGQIDRVLRLAAEYYPTEGDSPELGQAIEELNQTIERHYGIT